MPAGMECCMAADGFIEHPGLAAGLLAAGLLARAAAKPARA